MSAAPAARWPLVTLAVVLAGLGLVPIGNFVSAGELIPWWSSAVRLWLIWAALTALVTVGSAWLAPRAVDRLIELARRLLLATPPRVFAISAAVLATLLALYFGSRLFASAPTTSDEFAQLFQARLLTMGRLFARAEANPEFFSSTMTLDVGGRWFAQFPIGGPTLLSVGLALGIPALVNPILTGLSVLALYRFASATMPETVARGATLLFALSPFVLFMGGSEMNHVATLASVLLALSALPQWAESEDPARVRRAALTIGLSVGIAATIRPYDAALVALAIGTFQLSRSRASAMRRHALVVQCVAGAIPVAIVLWANWRTVGHPLAFAYDVVNGPEHRPGFHVGPSGHEHTPARGAALISSYLWKLDFVFLGWPIPILLVVAATLALLRRPSRWDLLMAGLVTAVLAGYFVYWGDGHFVGPRFLFVLTPVIAIWVARFPQAVADLVHAPVPRRAALLVAPVLTLVAWTLPANRAHPYGVRTLARTFEARVPSAELIVSRVNAAGISRAVVFVDDGWHSRLASRMRAIGMRPFVAEQFAFSVDACTLQSALDQLDQSPLTSEQRAAALRDVASRDAEATQLAGMSALDQLALVRDRPLRPACAPEMRSAESGGLSYAQLLPYQSLDATGALGGDVVYARHFGARNELLRARFGDRAWYVARVRREGASHRVTLEAYRR